MAKKTAPINKVKNKLYYGDNIDILRKSIKDESIDLLLYRPTLQFKAKV
jgi:hypothetical protein